MKLFNSFRILIYFIALTVSERSLAQCDSSSLIEPSYSCMSAVPQCRLDQMCVSMHPGIWGNNMLFCNGNFSLQNPHWFSFIPSENIIDIKIEVSNCQGGNITVQWGLFDQCINTLNSIDCNGGGISNGGVIAVFYGDTIPGKQYYLVIDGSSGTTCDLKFNVSKGTNYSGIREVIDSNLIGDKDICPDNLHAFSFGGFPDADQYIWSINDQNLDTTNVPNLLLTIPSLADGIYDLCVLARSDCDTIGTKICWPVEIDSKRTIVMKQYICEQDSFLFQNNYYTVGNYEIEETEAGNCIAKINHLVVPYGFEPDTIFEFLVCKESETYDYEDFTYKVDSLYNDVTIESADGCRFETNLIFKRISNQFKIISGRDSLSCLGASSTTLSFNGQFNEKVINSDILWFDENDQQIGTGNSVNVNLPGNYYCIVKQTFSGNTPFFSDSTTFKCEDSISYTIHQSHLNIPEPLLKLESEDKTAAKYLFSLSNFSHYPGGTQIDWIIPDNVISSEFSSLLEIKFLKNGNYKICAGITHECFEKDTVCLDILVDYILKDDQLNLPVNFKLKNNPVRDQIIFTTLNTVRQEVEITLSDIQGKKLKTEKFTSFGIELIMNVNDLLPGAYFYQIKDYRGKLAGKFIKI